MHKLIDSLTWTQKVFFFPLQVVLETSDLGADSSQFLTHPQNQNEFCVML